MVPMRSGGGLQRHQSSHRAPQAAITRARPVRVKNQPWVFINCLIENPDFSSQTKERMTLKQSSFGSACSIPRAFIDEVFEKTDIVNSVISEAQATTAVEGDADAESHHHYICNGGHMDGRPKCQKK